VSNHTQAATLPLQLLDAVKTTILSDFGSEWLATFAATRGNTLPLPCRTQFRY
jgi:hypothetical protein